MFAEKPKLAMPRGPLKLGADFNGNVDLIACRLNSSIAVLDVELTGFLETYGVPVGQKVEEIHALTVEICDDILDMEEATLIKEKREKLESMEEQLLPVMRALDLVCADSELLGRAFQVEIPGGAAVQLPRGLSAHNKRRIITLSTMVDARANSVGADSPDALKFVAFLCRKDLANGADADAAKMFR